MKVLVTGGTGFVGKNLIPLLQKEKKIEEIFLLVRNKEKVKKLFDDNKIKVITLEEDFEEVIVDKVIHLAAYLTSLDTRENIEKLIDSNLKFGTLVLDYVKNKKIKEFINFGTFAEYQFGNKLKSAYLYSATKTAFRSILDYYSETYKFKYYNVIPYTIYGGEDTQKKVIDYIKDSFIKEVNMTAGEQILDFIHIDDVCDFIIKLLLRNNEIPDKQEFFLGTGKGTSIRELSKILEKKYNKTCKINWGKLSYRPNDIMYAVAPIGNNLKYLNWKASILLGEKL
jgi:CDP-paratose synthetase